MAYVPPAQRRRQEAASGGLQPDYERRPPTLRGCEAPEEVLPTVDDIQTHFWPRQGQSGHSNTGASEAKNLGREHTAEVKTTPDASTYKHSTLNGTAKEPNKLGYLLLFRGAVSLHVVY